MAETQTQALPETLGHLRHCRIEGLFGRRDIDFRTAEEGPTLLYGRNGSGKSTILRLVDDLAHVRLFSLLERPFDRIELTFERGNRLAASRTSDSVTLVLDDHSWPVSRDDLQEARRHAMARQRRFEETGRVPPAGQVTLFEAEALAGGEWPSLIPQLFPVFLIEDQRLILRQYPDAPSHMRHGSGRGQPPRQWAVQEFKHALYMEMQRALSQYASHSQELDRRFPVKIASAVETHKADPEREESEVREVRELLERVGTERQALQRVGLLGREEGPMHFDPRRLEAESVRPVIRAFAEDTLAKFEVLSDLRLRLELFTAFLNQHYQEKDVITSRDEGFTVVLEDGRELRPRHLSSGEQQVLALAYQVLFGSDPGTLILIDEPELSLHVLWQSTLIDDLMAMAKARDVTFVLATHSPTLIGDRVELTRSLDSPPGNGPLEDSTGTDEEMLDELLDDLEITDDPYDPDVSDVEEPELQ